MSFKCCVKTAVYAANCALRRLDTQGAGGYETRPETTGLSEIMVTKSTKAAELERHWFVIDASGQSLGRLAAKVAHVLRGKHRPEFTPHVDTGDFVIVTNASDVKLTGNKLVGKNYYHHTGYPGALQTESYGHLLERKPEFVIEKAVRGMLPKNRLGRQMLRKLKVYPTGTHPHAAQAPEPFPL